MKNQQSKPETPDGRIACDSISCSLDSPGSLESGVDRLVHALGRDVELLGFGEALHGSGELLKLRNRIFRHLVIEHGFTAIAIETSFPRAGAVNEYILGTGAAAYENIQETGFSHGFGRHESTRELVEWMRRYNADASHSVKLRFYGFDSPTEMMSADSPRVLLDVVLGFLGGFDAGVNTARHDRIASLLGEDAAWENSAAMFDPSRSVGGTPNASALRLETEDLIAEMSARRPELTTRAGLAAYLQAVRHATLAREMLTYHATVARPSDGRTAKLLGHRDAMMAENLVFTLAHQRALGGGSVFAFAHNMHLKRGIARWQLGPKLLEWWPAGAHLHGLLGPRYAAIGTGVAASPVDGIAPPDLHTLEGRIIAGEDSRRSVRMVLTGSGRGVSESETGQNSIRSTSGANSTYFPLTAESWKDYDCLAVVNAST